MAMSKEQRRKIYGIREPKDPADPEVLSRQGMHIALLKWDLKWGPYIQIISAITAVALIFLPTIYPGWKIIIENWAIAIAIHNGFTRLSVWMGFSVIILVISSFYASSKLDGASCSHHGYPINLSGVRSSRLVLDLELFPRTKQEEKIFLADFISGIWAALVFWPILLGAVSIFIKTR